MTNHTLTTTVTPANGEYLNGFECIDCIHQMSAAAHESLVQVFEEAKLKDAVDVVLFIEQ